MAQLPGCAIGAHTLNHVQLRGQTAAVKRQEIAGSVELLKSLLGRPIRTFAYPYGDHRAVDPESRRLVREAGCDLACSTDPGLAQPGRRRFRLPRIVVGDWSVAELRSLLGSAAHT
jgi:peptidoglycan/xylan/chitin deacetylase (PgdA/CDA1 family)